jgi:hypothetical protein
VLTIHGPRCITPPRLLEHLLKNKDGDVRRASMRTLLSTARLRGERTARASFAATAAPANGRRTVFDCRHSTFLPLAVTARSEDGAASADDSVNRAFDGLGATRTSTTTSSTGTRSTATACGSTDTCTTTAPTTTPSGTAGSWEDPDAPIFEISDFGVVGDLFSIAPQLQEEISKRHE